jgi:NCS1 family nucleobase:cation symporter-1
MLAAWVAGVAFTVHGVAGSLDPDSFSTVSKNMYKLGFLLSLCMGGLVYYVLCLIWPVPILPVGAEQCLAFEDMAANEGFFDTESIGTITGVLEGEEVVSEHYMTKEKSDKV